MQYTSNLRKLFAYTVSSLRRTRYTDLGTCLTLVAVIQSESPVNVHSEERISEDGSVENYLEPKYSM